MLSDDPFILFGSDISEKHHKELLKKYHPDHSGSNEDFLRVQAAWHNIQEMLKAGFADTGKHVLWHNRAFSYDLKEAFTGGTFYFLEGNLAVWKFDTPPVIQVLPLFRVPSEMKEQFSAQLPQGVLDGTCYTVQIPPGYIRLKDAKGLPPETAIWITNRLYSLGEFLHFISFVPLDVCPANIWVNFKEHVLMLAGGLWFAAAEGARMKALPLATYELLSEKQKEDKTACSSLYEDQVKAVLLPLLDAEDKGLSPIVDWLSTPSGPDIHADFTAWHDVYKKVFPVSKFFEWEPK